MPKRTCYYTLTCTLAAVLLVSGCRKNQSSNPPPPPTIHPAHIVLASQKLPAGETTKATVEVITEAQSTNMIAHALMQTVIPASKITWSTSDNTVATVDSQGNVKGVAKGTIVLNAASPGYSITPAQVNVCANVIKFYLPNTTGGSGPNGNQPFPACSSTVKDMCIDSTGKAIIHSGGQAQLNLELDCPSGTTPQAQLAPLR